MYAILWLFCAICQSCDPCDRYEYVKSQGDYRDINLQVSDSSNRIIRLYYPQIDRDINTRYSSPNRIVLLRGFNETLLIMELDKLPPETAFFSYVPKLKTTDECEDFLIGFDQLTLNYTSLDSVRFFENTLSIFRY